jgi:hypothetical protein
MDAPPKPSTSRNEPRLLDQIREVIRRFHYSIRTEKAYIDWIPPYCQQIELSAF